MYRVGLVGFGSIAEHGHLPAWQSLKGVEVVAVADVAPERLAHARELLPRATLFSEPLRLIEDADITVVDICTPPSTHVDLILAALERGGPDIVSEKPLVLSDREYGRIAEARARSGRRLVSVNNWIHSDLFTQVRRAIDRGSIGAVQSVTLRTGRPDAARGNAGWMPRWRTDRAHSGGGIILDHGWHQFYLLLGWIRQPVLRVSATTRTEDPRHLPVEDEAAIDLEFPDAHSRIELSWTAAGRTNDGTIIGSDGTIAVEDDRIVVEGRDGREEIPFRGRLTESSYHPDWFRSVFETCILERNRDEADRNFAEAGSLVRIIGAAYQSAREHGAPVRLPLNGAGPAGAPGAESRGAGIEDSGELSRA